MIEIENLKPFPKFCYTIGMIPSSYKESLTYEEQLIWFCSFLQDTVIPTVNNNGQAVEELQNLFIELTNYVDNYFENLDVQEEIDNKLDEMVPELTALLLNYTSIEKVYNTLQDMIEDTTLIENSKCRILGENSINDGNSAEFYITNTQDTSVIQVELDNGLYANYVNKNDFIYIDSSNFESVLCNDTQKDFKNYFIHGEINLDHAVTIKNLRWSTIRGDGFYRTKINVACESGGILFEDSTYNIFEDITFMSNTTNENMNWIQGDGDYIIKLKNARTFTFNNCYFRFANKDAIVITHSWLTTFNKCYFNDNYRYAINIEYSDSVQPNIIIDNCFINNSHEAGILIQTPQVFIKNSVLQSSEHGHIIIDSSGLDLYNIEIDGNDMEISGDKADIIFKGSNDIEFVSVTHNTMANNTQGQRTKIIDCSQLTGNMRFLKFKQNNFFYKDGFIANDNINKLNYTDDIDYIGYQTAYDQILPVRGCGRTNAILFPLRFNAGISEENIILPYKGLNGTLTIISTQQLSGIQYKTAFGTNYFTSDDNLTWTGELKGAGLIVVTKGSHPNAQVNSSIYSGYYEK